MVRWDILRRIAPHVHHTRLANFPSPHPRSYSVSRPVSDDAEEDVGLPDEAVWRWGEFNVVLPKEPIVWGVSHIVPRAVPAHIRRPGYACLSRSDQGSEIPEPLSEHWASRRIQLGSETEVGLRAAARLASDVLKYAGTLVKVRRTTEAIDAKIHEVICSRSAYPSPLLYKGFPKSCCTSVNNIITHGIPDDRPLEDGDIVNIDITVFKDGFHGDTSKTFLVGEVDDMGRDLVQVTETALELAIAECGPKRPFKNIGKVIHSFLRNKDYCVSPQFTGHGIGEDFHRIPWILHHMNDEPGVMLPGDCFTIEPIIIQGTNPKAWIWPDGWAASTLNCARGAQAEHMVLITETGADVLTRQS
ncbi:methionine aminopeptidase [Obba rivulosa]|uniref:Methionine aminopeptidase n=1 Tax=Obba rivulosa TaxID=1052685 RepID=A0A8E2DRR0_9APHY|nr:methionine aminopeptidase [Obba rivulosa]